MGWWQTLRIRRQARTAWCKRCGQRPRDPNLDVPDSLGDACTVRPADYCSTECVERAAEAALW